MARSIYMGDVIKFIPTATVANTNAPPPDGIIYTDMTMEERMELVFKYIRETHEPLINGLNDIAKRLETSNDKIDRMTCIHLIRSTAGLLDEILKIVRSQT